MYRRRYRKRGMRRTTRRKKVYRRSRRYRNRGMKVLRRSPIAPRLFTKLIYADQSDINYTVANTLSLPFTFQTSIYDPDYSGTGHQPMWYDQYSYMYQNYVVLGIKYDITMTNFTGQCQWYAGVQHSSQASMLDTNIFNWMERKVGVVKIGGNQYGTDHVRIKGYMSNAKTQGVSPLTIRTENMYTGVFGGNPGLKSYLMVGLQGSAAFTGRICCKLTYYIELFNPVTPGQS